MTAVAIVAVLCNAFLAAALVYLWHALAEARKDVALIDSAWGHALREVERLRTERDAIKSHRDEVIEREDRTFTRFCAARRWARIWKRAANLERARKQGLATLIRKERAKRKKAKAARK